MDFSISKLLLLLITAYLNLVQSSLLTCTVNSSVTSSAIKDHVLYGSSFKKLSIYGTSKKRTYCGLPEDLSTARNKYSYDTLWSTGLSKKFLSSFEFEEYDDGTMNLQLKYKLQKFQGCYLPLNVDQCSHSQCAAHLLKWRRSLSRNEIWAQSMMDSWGNFPTLSYSGKADQPGDYEQCLSIEHENLSGKYCTIYLQEKNTSEFSVYDELRSQFGVLSGLDLEVHDRVRRSYGTCIPSSCTDLNILDSVKNATKEFNIEIRKVVCAENRIRLTVGDHIFLGLTAVILLLMVCATLMESKIGANKHRNLWKFVQPFSPVRNLKEIFQLPETKASDEVQCIKGIRVLSMVCVIVCHQYGMTSHTSNVYHIYGTGEGVSWALALIASSASLSVDTFLCISGFLLSYSKLKDQRTPGRNYVKKMYVNRILRLTPCIIGSCFFFATIGRRLIRGPWSQDFELISEACRKHWWKEAFQVVNFFYKSEDRDSFPMCNGQSWSTAVDTQLYFFSPIVLIPLMMNYISGYLWLGLVTVGSILAQFTIIYVNQLPPTTILSLSIEENLNFYTQFYVMPWCRCGPWFVGIWAGLALARCSSIKVTVKKYQVIGWLMTILVTHWTVGQIISFNTQPSLYAKSGHMYLALFGATHRMMWALAVSWIILASHCQCGGVVNDFLSYEGWRPLSRLTYPTYVVALNVQFMIAFSKKQVVHFSQMNNILDSGEALVLSLLLGLVLSITVEMPVVKIFSELL